MVVAHDVDEIVLRERSVAERVLIEDRNRGRDELLPVSQGLGQFRDERLVVLIDVASFQVDVDSVEVVPLDSRQQMLDERGSRSVIQEVVIIGMRPPPPIEASTCTACRCAASTNGASAE